MPKIPSDESLPEALGRLLVRLSRPWTESSWKAESNACAAASERFLTTSGKLLGSVLILQRGRRRYVSLDGKGVDLGGCWSPGSSPGMIPREH
jgi:hypothetical protein